MLIKALICVAIVAAVTPVARKAIDQAHTLSSVSANLVEMSSPAALRDPSTDARLRALADHARQVAGPAIRQTKLHAGNAGDEWQSLECVEKGCAQATGRDGGAP